MVLKFGTPDVRVSKILVYVAADSKCSSRDVYSVHSHSLSRPSGYRCAQIMYGDRSSMVEEPGVSKRQLQVM